MKKYRCKICGYIYDDAKEKVKFEDLPSDWKCPLCGAPKHLFEEIKEEEPKEESKEAPKEELKEMENAEDNDELRELSDAEIAYICFNLAKGCEKQYLDEEQALFNDLANHYLQKLENTEGTITDIKNCIKNDSEKLKQAMECADEYQDRGAKRVINWASKTTNIVSAILEQYEKEGTESIKDTKIWVCDICGFVYIGDEPPKVCPVCKVPSFKILEVK